MKRMNAIRKSITFGLSGFFSLGFLALSVIARALNKLGYYGVCSFAPFITIILLLMTLITTYLACRVWKW